MSMKSLNLVHYICDKVTEDKPLFIVSWCMVLYDNIGWYNAIPPTI